MSEEKITYKQLLILSALRSLEEESPTGVVSVRELTRATGKKAKAVYKLLYALRRRGLVENPVRGGWRTSKKGRELLEAFRIE